MRIYVPSLGRYNQIAHKGTIAHLPKSLRPRITLVVPTDQHQRYADATQHMNIELFATPDHVKGIAATRHEIGKYAHSRNEEKFMMMDDDIYQVQIRKSKDVWNLRFTTPEETEEMFEHIEDLLEDYAHVGVSPREGNSHAGIGTVNELLRENTRTLRALAYRTADFLSVEHGRVPVMEDFDVNLQLLERGLSNVATHWWAQGQQMTNAAGGCSTYRTRELHEAAAHKLADLHPGLVRLRQKQNKTDRDGFGTRTEVVISWKRSFRSRTTIGGS